MVENSYLLKVISMYTRMHKGYIPRSDPAGRTDVLLQDRQEIFKGIARLVEHIPQAKRPAVKPILETLEDLLRPSDQRRQAKSPKHRKAISDAFAAKRAVEIFSVSHAETGDTIQVVGWDNLSRLVGLSDASIRVRFSLGRGTMHAVAAGSEAIIKRTRTFAEAPKDIDPKDLKIFQLG